MILQEIIDKLPKGAKIKISQTYLECTEGSSNKFYRTIVVTNANTKSRESAFVTNYGAISTYGQKSVQFGLTESQAFANERKKIVEKQRKGYVEAVCPERRNLGCPGADNVHIFGENKAKDELFLGRLEDAVCGGEVLEKILTACAFYDETLSPEEIERRMQVETAAKALAEAKERERLKAIEDERKASYDSNWGAWA